VEPNYGVSNGVSVFIHLSLHCCPAGEQRATEWDGVGLRSSEEHRVSAISERISGRRYAVPSPVLVPPYHRAKRVGDEGQRMTNTAELRQRNDESKR
jgi:hypothetical protein